jgi:hypothetical protein
MLPTLRPIPDYLILIKALFAICDKLKSAVSA